MTTSYQLGVQPRWILVDLSAKFAGGGKLYHWSNLDKRIVKPVYQTPDGTLEWPNPILFDSNGVQGPFYFVFDDGNPDDTYFLQAYDRLNNLLWTEENYTGQSSSSGGGGGTTNLHLKNLIINNVFWRNNLDEYDSPVPNNTIICPGAHAGYAQTETTSGLTALSDVRYFTDSVSANDSVEVIPFPLGSNPFLASGDITPEYYLSYDCLNSPVPETYKYFQWPINSQVNTLDNQNFVGSIWAKCASGNYQVPLYYWQFYGTGDNGPTSTSPTLITTLNLTADWTKYNFSDVFADSGASTEGNDGNSAVFFQVGMPLESQTSIQFVKPTLYLGNQLPLFDFDTNDTIDSQISSPRCGDIRVSLNAFSPYGWILCNDGMLGGSTSITPPAGLSIARYNLDTYQLFSILWEIGNADPTFAQIYDSAGVATSWVSPDTDFAGDKQIQVTKILGRALASGGLSDPGGTTTFKVGEFTGSEEYSLVANDLPVHTHASPAGGQFYVQGGGSTFTDTGVGPIIGTQGATGNNTTTHTPISLMQPTAFFNVFLKL